MHNTLAIGQTVEKVNGNRVDVSTRGGWRATDWQGAAALAAQRAIEKGEDPVKAAQAVRAQAQPQPAPTAAPTSHGADVRDYLTACAQLARGDFDSLTTAALLDIALLIKAPVHDYATWLTRRAEFNGANG